MIQQPSISPVALPVDATGATLTEWAAKFAKEGRSRGIGQQKKLTEYVSDELARVFQVPAQFSISQVNEASKDAVSALRRSVASAATVATAPAAAPVPIRVPDSPLLASAKVFAKQGRDNGKSGNELRGYVEALLDGTGEWKTATEAERTTALQTAVPDSATKSSSTAGATVKERLREARSKKAVRVVIFAAVMLFAWRVGFELFKVFVSSVRGSFASSTGIPISVLTGDSAASVSAIAWILRAVALVIGGLAVWAYYKSDAEILPKTRLVIFSVVLLVAAVFAAIPSGAAAATANPHGEKVVFSEMLNTACAQSDPTGKFGGASDALSCVGSLLNDSRLKASNDQVKLGDRWLALSAYLANCQSQPYGITTDTGKGQFAQCAGQGLKHVFGEVALGIVAAGK